MLIRQCQLTYQAGPIAVDLSLGDIIQIISETFHATGAVKAIPVRSPPSTNYSRDRSSHLSQEQLFLYFYAMLMFSNVHEDRPLIVETRRAIFSGRPRSLQLTLNPSIWGTAAQDTAIQWKSRHNMDQS